MNIYKAKNKTEKLMNEVIERLSKSKKKYFIVVQDSRGVQYVDGIKDKEFLKSIAVHLEDVVKDVK